MTEESINHGGHPNTAPVSEAPASASRIDPEFVDCKGLEAGWGIKRSLAYQLLADGKIQGVSLRRRNQIRGKRLFKVDSVRAFLRSQMEAGR
jgi:hypothetical protein